MVEERRGPGRPMKRVFIPPEMTKEARNLMPNGLDEDGTYYNESDEQKANSKKTHLLPRPGEIFKTKGGSQFQVIHVLDWGVYVFGYPHTRQPRIEDCDFWDIEKFIDERSDA